ncbi:serine-rich adhesin for platelets-like isoform X1 [Argopecten irradians]|uniref:serine-rich adhesin for platelets-like isoform X1 n=1 Tax=Argopecten irradians TaxID=31199 RepID=UPI00371FE4D6
MSGPPSNIPYVDRLASVVESDALPDAVGRPPPIISTCTPSQEFSGSGDGKPVLRGTGQVYETSEGSSGGSARIPSAVRQSSSTQSSDAYLPDPVSLNKFLENYTFLHRYPSSEKQKFMKRLKLIMKHFERFPDNLKAAYYDVMVLYSEDDRNEADSYCQSLNELTLDNGKRVKAVLYDVMDFANMKRRMFGSLEMAFQRCTFAFVYLTKQFCQCEWSQIASEECLMEAIYNKEKRWCVVPVYTVQRTKADFNIPMGLNSLKGVNYYNNDDFYRRGLRTLISGKIYKREDNEEKLYMEQYQHAVMLEHKLQLEEEVKRQSLKQAEQQQWASPRPSDTAEVLQKFNIKPQGGVDSSAYTPDSFNSNKSLDYQTRSFVPEESSLGSLNSQGPRGDQSESSIYYSTDGEMSATVNPRQNQQNSSLQVDMPSSLQSQMTAGQPKTQSATKEYLVGSDELEGTMDGKTVFDKDGKVIVHHVHTHTHYYNDKESVKSKKKVVNIYGAEKVMIGDDNTIVEGGTSDSPTSSNSGGEMSTTSRKKPDSSSDSSPSLPCRQSMEGPSRQSIDGQPSLPLVPSPDVFNTATKEMLPAPNTEPSAEENITETIEKTVSGSSVRFESLQTSKAYFSSDTTTAVAASLPATRITSTVQSNIQPNVSSTFAAAKSSEKVEGNTEITQKQTMKSVENMQNAVASSPSLIKSSHQSGVSNAEASTKKDRPMINLPKRPIIFSDCKAKPQALATVMPLRSQNSTTSDGDEFRNNFGSSSEPEDCSKPVSRTEQKEVCQSHSTHVKTPVTSAVLSDEEETEVKQVATVSPLTPSTDLEPDCSNSMETSLKSYAGLGLTETDQSDQAVSKVLEMGFRESQIKAALLSLQSRAPGRKHFSVPNLLDEIENLPESALQPQSPNRSSDLDTDCPSESGFVLLNNEPSRHDRQMSRQGSNLSTNSTASRNNRGSPNPEQSPRSDIPTPRTGSPSKDAKDKCKIS